jgi:hypothetical protein
VAKKVCGGYRRTVGYSRQFNVKILIENLADPTEFKTLGE